MCHCLKVGSRAAAESGQDAVTEPLRPAFQMLDPLLSFVSWEERSICSVANLTRRDGEEFLALAPKVRVRTEVQIFPLEEANDAIARLRGGKVQGAAVLVTDTGK